MILKRVTMKRTNRRPDAAMDKALADLIQISNLVGRDPALESMKRFLDEQGGG
jgi:hypothetical protein